MKTPPYMPERVVLEARSGAVSGPVRVSYFDPRTGEPCDERPEPLSRRAQAVRSREIAGYEASLERGRKKRPCTVDGVRYESIAAASRATRLDRCGLGAALKEDRGEYKGREVAYA